MHIEPAILTTRSRRKDLITAIHACEKNDKLLKGSVKTENIKTFPGLEDRFGDVKEDQIPFATKAITNELKSTARLLMVDACAFSEPLSLLNAHQAQWGIADDVTEKLRLIAYDDVEPEKSDVAMQISEALRMIDSYKIHRSILFITLEGHAFNFDIKLGENIDSLPVRSLPEFSEIIEVKEENAERRIRKHLEGGKTVVVDKALLARRPGLTLAFSSYTELQKKKLIMIG